MILTSITPQFHNHNHNHHNLRHQFIHKPSSSTTTAVHCRNPNLIRQVNISNTNGNGNGNVCEEEDDNDDDAVMVTSASAVAAAIRKASTSPVEFMQRIEQRSKSLVLPSSDFQSLCVQQLDLFRRIVDPHAVLSVYVRPAGSYVMDMLELRRVTVYPEKNVADILVVIGNFSISAGLRAAEASLLKQQDRY